MSQSERAAAARRASGSDAPMPATVALVAHRAAEDVSNLRAARDVADLVEIDVHLFRGRLEARHAKVLWPFAIRWDRWHFVPAGSPRPMIDEIVQSVDLDTHLWLDLKGFDRRLSSEVVAVISDRLHTTVSSRSWWILPRQGRYQNLRVVHSVGSRLQLWALRRRAPGSVEAVAINRRLVDAGSMAALRRVTSTVFVWGVHDVAEGLRAVEAGADGLIVDGIETIAHLRDRLVRDRDDRNP
jgi:glycerophosphoryl diester phosphodiesterase